MKRVGGTNQLTVRLSSTGADEDLWVVTRATAREFETAQLNLIRRVSEHVGRLVRMRRTLVSVDALGLTLTEALEHAGAGIFLLDASGHIVECNDRARELLADDGGLADRDGQLGASSLSAQRALHSAVREAASGKAPTASSVRVPTAEHGRWLLADVSPVPQPVEALAAPVAALVVIRDPWAEKAVDPEIVQQILGVTAAEAEVAALVAEGRTVREIAALRHRSEASVRWHLKQLYGRTGLRGQTDLVRVVRTAFGT